MNDLQQYGWKPVFAQQMLAAGYDASQTDVQPARVVEVQRSGLVILPRVGDFSEIALGGRWFQLPPTERPTVGDWILVDVQTGAVAALLERTSEIKRLAPSGEAQLIAANIDTAFVVTSANADFSISRLERYMSVLLEADIQPVVVITKADLADEAQTFVDAVHDLPGGVLVELVNSLDAATLQGLLGWCGPGQSIALLGSSGVGKSTLVNTLCGESVQQTQDTREGDDKGRHTTTHRSLHLLPSGGVILDSPGMREFQIADAESGVSSVFSDIETLATQCKFNDCAHQAEPGCAIRQALADGRLDERRLANYFKLLREERINSESIAERHARARQFNKVVKAHTEINPKFRR